MHKSVLHRKSPEIRVCCARPGLPEAPFVQKTATDRLDVLEAKGLSYIHPESGLGVSDVNLRLERGSFTVVTGRIGSGKTTLLCSLIGWLPHQAGEILWNGSVVDEPDKFLVPPRCGYTSQGPRLFSEELRSNILMGLPEERVDLPGAVSSTVMEQDIEELEKGLDTIVGPKGVKLSRGQQRRSGAARMFVREPELLILDDLSSGLDVETEQTLWRAYLNGRTRRPWSSHTVVRPCATPTTSSSSRTAESRLRASSTTC